MYVYMLLAKARTLLEWADEILSKMLDGSMGDRGGTPLTALRRLLSRLLSILLSCQDNVKKIYWRGDGR